MTRQAGIHLTDKDRMCKRKIEAKIYKLNSAIELVIAEFFQNSAQ